MKRSILLAICAVVLGCSPSTSPSPPPDESASVVPQVPSGNRRIEYDAGAIFVKDRPQLELSIPVDNSTGRSIHFVSIDKSCSCSCAELSQMTLEAGGTASLAFSANLVGRSGRQRFACGLRQDNGSVWTIDVVADLYDSFRLSQPTVVFANVHPNQIVDKSVTVDFYARVPEDIPEVLALSSPPRHLDVRIGEPSTTHDVRGIWCRSWPLTISTCDRLPPGPGSEVVAVQASGRPSVSPASIVCHWNKLSAYQVSPSKVFFGVTQSTPDSSRSAVVLVARTDGRPMRLLSVKGDGNGLRVTTIRHTDPSSLQIRIDVDESAITKDASRELVFTTDDAKENTIRVPVFVKRVQK